MNGTPAECRHPNRYFVSEGYNALTQMGAIAAVCRECNAAIARMEIDRFSSERQMALAVGQWLREQYDEIKRAHLPLPEPIRISRRGGEGDV